MNPFPPVTRAAPWAALLIGAFLAAGLPALAHPAIDKQIADLTARIEAAPTAALYVRRAELHRIHRDWDLARADFDRARELEPELADIDFGLGRLLLDADKPAEAVTALSRFLAVRPDHSAALAARARARALLGQHAEAAKDFDAAIAHLQGGPGQPGYYLERARALVAASPDNRARALAGLDEGLERLGQPVTLQLLAIEYEIELNHIDGALARLDRIAAQSSRKETWLLRRAEILENAGRIDEARSAYNRTLDAIEGLRPGRRANRAVQRLETAARAGAERTTREPEAKQP